MSNSTNTTSGYAPFDLYPYNPAQPPAFAFMALFGIAAVVHLALMIPYRAFFPFPMILGCAMECGGYYFRTRSHDNMRQTLPFILQYLLILCAPPLLAATIYMSPGRILRAMKVEEVSLISPRWQTKLFVLVDLVCFATQFAGVIMSGSTDSDEASRGKTIIMVGLVVQVLSFGVYIIALFTAQVRLRQMQTAVLGGPELHWGRYFCALYVASGLFLIRNAVRIIEEKQGSDSPISKNEGYLYGLDALFMFAVAVIIIFLHPGRLIRKANKVSKASYLESGLAMEQSI